MTFKMQIAAPLALGSLLLVSCILPLASACTPQPVTVTREPVTLRLVAADSCAPLVEDVAANQEHKLVEALGERIASAVLARFDADAVTVTVRKPTPIAGVLRYAGVRITRTRDDAG